tara:strand:- start:2296 stop:2514 length:219 start_codon:yes stop_codon:yes gene_type:complete
MNFEFEDYRKKEPPPSYQEWSPKDPIRYCMMQVAFLFVLPFLLGFALTPIGLFFNVILIDYILYKRAVIKPY